MDVDGSLLEQIRVQKRHELKWDQKSHRKKELDRNRAGLGELHHSVGVIEHITEQEVKALAARIKRRKRCEPLDLVRLSYGFQQSKVNISQFIRITGAINVIVKELTGHDYNLQLLAAECLCNLSLGDDTCCEKIASFAGTYLIALAENPNCRPLQQTCLWTLQNIVGSSPKGSKLLFSQGLVVILIRLLSTVTDEEAADDIILTLELALNYEQEMEPLKLTQIVQCFVGKELRASSLRLLHKCYGLIPNDVLLYESTICVLRQCLDFLGKMNSVVHLSQHAAPIILSIRILAHHVAANRNYIDGILQYQLHKNSFKFSVLFNECASENMLPVCKEFLWFLGQLHSNGAVENDEERLKSYLAFDNFVEHLRVPEALL